MQIFSDSLAIILEFLKSHPDNLDALLEAKDTQMKMTPLHTAADSISSAPTRFTFNPKFFVGEHLNNARGAFVVPGAVVGNH